MTTPGQIDYKWGNDLSNLSIGDYQLGGQQSVANPIDNMDFTQGGGIPQTGTDWGGWAKGFGDIAGGIGGLAQAWQGIEGLKLAKKQLKAQNAQWQKNYDAQRGDIAHNRAQRAQSRGIMYS